VEDEGQSMKTFIVSALSVAVACALAGCAMQNPSNQISSSQTAASKPLKDPFKPNKTNGLSNNPNACASYGCVGAGGGGD
jgi:hypothetical protein